jgi:hypothetical protein
MKVIGVDISGRDVRLVALANCSGDIVNFTGKYKPLRLEDDDKAENVLLFKNALFATLENYSPDAIVINFRDPNATGKYAPSPLSFKIEGIIQLYENAIVCFTKPQTIAAFYKKNSLDIAPAYTYQKDALKIAFHHLKTN